MPFLGFVFLLNGKSFFTFGPSIGISLHLLHPYIGSEFKNLRGKLGHSQDFSKDGSQCVKVRVLTRLSCHFCHLLWVVCLKKAHERGRGGGGVTSTPGSPSGYTHASWHSPIKNLQEYPPRIL